MAPRVDVKNEETDECTFCRATCPSRDLFKDPDSGLPLKCDMCEGEEGGPLCVEWCLNDVLILEEWEEKVEETVQANEMDAGLESSIDKCGIEKIGSAFVRMTQTN